ncbi:hypothetical protein GF362_03485 [Candidatus Dojkabacteria bacterium]|nr:hypothetical protein [Candidatus Dojkabacteria bacterium]
MEEGISEDLKSNNSKFRIIYLFIGIGCALICGVSFIILSLFVTGIQKVNKQAEVTKMKAQMRQIQMEIETYYIENLEYPEDLESAGIENNILGKEVTYSKLSQDAYEVSVNLPNGEEHIIYNDLGLD